MSLASLDRVPQAPASARIYINISIAFPTGRPGKSIMPQSSVGNYTDAEEMEAAEIAARTEIIPVGSSPLTAHYIHVKLEHLGVLRANERGSRIKHIFLDPKRTFITFETGPGLPRFRFRAAS
jgi:hypothetical protein